MTDRKERFSLEKLNSLRQKTKKPYWIEDPMECFWTELEMLLRAGDSENPWEKLEGEPGDVWRYNIGEVYYRHTVHKFSWLYVETTGEAVGEHGHEQPANQGRQKRLWKEWYVFFYDGRIEVCAKGQTHKLVNNYGKPIYVLSIKVGSNGNR